MDFLRLYLAVCVLVGHANSPIFPWTIHNGEEAVEIFFMISGFYMSLVAPKYSSVKQFYVSRFLRIFFPYWVALGFVIVLSVGFGVFGGNWLELSPYFSRPFEKNGFIGVAFTTLTNLTIFFQDWVLFFKHDVGGSLVFTNNFWESSQPLFHYLLIPQAWSISLELFFYLLFPFMRKLKSKSLVLILIVSLLARIFSYQVFHATRDPWRYRFFPFEIALFVMGMLSFRIYSSLTLKERSYPVKNIALYFLICSALLFVFIGAKFASVEISRLFGVLYARLLLYLLWAFVIPLLFHLFKTSETDRFVGELSYPVYLIHFIMIALIKIVMDAFGLSSNLLGIVSVVVIVATATGFYVFIIKRLDDVRNKIVIRQV